MTHLTFDPALLQQLPPDLRSSIHILIDARDLTCPMPLLKAKLALKNTPIGKQIYVLASDHNSQTDIRAYCQKHAIELLTWTSHTPTSVFHFVIKKP